MNLRTFLLQNNVAGFFFGGGGGGGGDDIESVDLSEHCGHFLIIVFLVHKLGSDIPFICIYIIFFTKAC